MSVLTQPLSPAEFVVQPRAATLPPLENGDRLTRHEFMRRWEAMPQVKRAELIEGIVYMAAAVRHEQHGRPHAWLMNVLSTYAMRTPGIDFGDNATVGLDADNAPQPDTYLFLPVELGSKATVNAKGYLEGPPDLIGEVAASSASMDLHGKFEVYRRHGVREYLVWRVLERTIDWFVLENDQYVPLRTGEDGTFRSPLFRGLWIHGQALIEGNAELLWSTLDQGLASPEYLAFADTVKRVAQSKSK